MKRRPRLFLAALAGALAFGGPWLWRHRAVVWTPAAPATAAPTYRLGSVTFVPCTLRQPHSGLATHAWCAPFRVPEDWAHPAGPTIALRLALIRSRAARPARDLMVPIAGGPGQSIIDSWPEMAPALDGVLAHRSVVLLDQRGTGGSTPLTCPKAAPAHAASAPAPDRLSPRSRRKALDAEVRACLGTLRARGLHPADFTTTQFVADLAALRHALGNPPFDLVGVSYGTRVAQQFAMRHPAAVRSMVLDSVVPNALILGQDFGVNLDAALHADFDLCKSEPGCTQTFGNPWDTLVGLKRALAKNTPEVRFRGPGDYAPAQEPLTPGRLVGLVRLYAYSSLTAALLPLTIHAASRGHYGPLLAQSRFIAHSLSHTLDDGLQLSVVCSEDAPWLKATQREATTLLGDRYIRELQAQCAIWPRGAMPRDFHAPLRSSVPTLLLAGQFDPVTPPRYAREVLRGLGDGRLLIAPGQGHNVIGAGCMPRLVRRFINRIQPRKLDARCLDALKPTPPFLNYNGGAP